MHMYTHIKMVTVLLKCIHLSNMNALLEYIGLKFPNVYWAASTLHAFSDGP